MAGGKSSPPLFELLGQGKGDSISRQAKSFIPGSGPGSGESASVGEGGEGGGGSPLGYPSAHAASGGSGSGGAGTGHGSALGTALGSGYGSAQGSGGVSSGATSGLVLSKAQALIGVGCLIGVIVAVWAFAYGAGARSKEAEWQRVIQRDQGIGPDPLALDGSRLGVDGGTDGGGAGDPARRAGSGAGGVPGSGVGGGGGGGLLGAGTGGFILSAGGVLPKDPRQPGQNYLRLATLPRAGAQGAIEYLAAGGVEAIGVPVDPGSGSANNPTRYAVFAMVGITGEEYKNRRPVMTDIEAKVARIGERYRREAKGPTDFSKPLWTKFNP